MGEDEDSKQDRYEHPEHVEWRKLDALVTDDSSLSRARIDEVARQNVGAEGYTGRKRENMRGTRKTK